MSYVTKLENQNQELNMHIMTLQRRIEQIEEKTTHKVQTNNPQQHDYHTIDQTLAPDNNSLLHSIQYRVTSFVLKQIDKQLQQLENNMVTTITEQNTSNTDSKCQSANSEQKPTSEKINTHENARDGQSTLEHYEQADIEHKTKFQNTTENNDCMNTGIVHTKQKVNPRGTTDQMPNMEQLHQKTPLTAQLIGQPLYFRENPVISQSCSGSLAMPCVQPMSRTDIAYIHPVQNQHFFSSCSTRKTQKVATNRLTIASYNCKNIKTSTLAICDLMRHANIILLQEHWLYQCQLYQLGEIHNDLCHVGKGVDKYEEIDQSNLPRGYRVVGICWHKDLDQIVGMVEGGNERIQCIEVNQISNKPILIICVYMPTSGGSVKTIEYHKKVDLLNELLQRYPNTHYIVIGGDINEDLSSRAVNSRKKVYFRFY